MLCISSETKLVMLNLLKSLGNFFIRFLQEFVEHVG